MQPAQSPAPAGAQWAVDIGSTVVKVARLDGYGGLASQQFHPRDPVAGIARQVVALLAGCGVDPATDPVLVCSSANGGLRVGIVALTEHYSGATLRSQALLAGANPVFVHDLDRAAGDASRVDILLVGGGIDDVDAEPMARRLERFDGSRYRYHALVYCGNTHLAAAFVARYPGATVVPNPMRDTLGNRVGSVFETIRRAYLDDLVFKEGVSELPAALTRTIRPTPEVASRGFLRSVMNQSAFTIVGSCVALDIGGATTDVHYTVEVIAGDSDVRPTSGVSVGRYVFTDLGIAASRETLLLQLRNHPKLYELMAAVGGRDVRERYAEFREGEREPDAELMSCGCLFLALDRFGKGQGPGLPKAALDTVAQVILTGGAAQALDERTVARVIRLVLAPDTPEPLVQIDRRYEIWVAGITWSDEGAA